MAMEERTLAEVQKWWTDVRSQTQDYFKAGRFLPLPIPGNKLTAFHSSCELLYVREIFDALFRDLLGLLEVGNLCHLNGNSGVGKSAFLWYCIIRMGIQHPDAFIIYESEAFVWEFRGAVAEVRYKADYPAVRVLAEAVHYHLIDQKVDTSRPIGTRALVAASPDEANTKAARKLRTSYTRYMPAWDRPEYDALVRSWRERVEDLPEDSKKRREAFQRLDAAGTAYDWFGGVPGFLWSWEPGRLTEREFHSETSRCLAKTKLENVRAVLANAQSHSWRLFHFKTEPGDLSTFYYNFCSQKVADLYANYLVLENLEQLRTFIGASEPLPEYAVLRGFVFEQYVIGLALRTKLMGMPMLDDAYCRVCKRKEDQMKTPTVNWIKCDCCQLWYHMSCVRLKTVRNVYKCAGCSGLPQEQIDISGGRLLLRYYDGDLEDALMAAGSDAVNYLWRSLRKNNAAFDFALPPRTLGQITVAERHPASIEALAKAMRALNAWRAEFDPDSKDKDVLLLYLLPPNRFHEFGFQRYRQSGKVSQRAVAGVMQCTVAVDATPYAGFNLQPRRMQAETLDLGADLESWEKSLACIEDATWTETDFVSLEEERDRLALQNCVYDADDFLVSTDFTTLPHRQVQSICKQLGLPAAGTREALVSELEAYLGNKFQLDESDSMDGDSN